MTFSSPLEFPSSWNLVAEPFTPPASSRYAGRLAWGVRATLGAGSESVLAPARAVARGGPNAGGLFLELSPVPFVVRRALQRMRFGLPTFLLQLPGSAIVPAGVVALGDVVAQASDVWIGVLGQDGTPVDALSWSSSIHDALVAGGLEIAGWQPFHDAVVAAMSADAARPVLLLDHAARPLQGEVRISRGGEARTVRLEPGDAGNVQTAVARSNAAGTVPFASLFEGAATASLQRMPDPQAAEPPADRWVRLGDGEAAADSVTLTPAERHAMVTDFTGWFSQQQAVPATAADGPPLHWVTTGNRVTPLIDGHATFADLVGEIAALLGSQETGGLHVAGYRVDAGFPLVDDLPDGLTSATLSGLVTALAASSPSRASRVLAPEFIQGLRGSGAPAMAVLVLAMLYGAALVFDARGVWETDLAGGVLGAVAVLGAAAAAQLLIETDGSFLEPNRTDINALEAIHGVEAVLDAHPARNADNPIASGVATWFGMLDRFGIFHDKLVVLDRAGAHSAYLGGVDINPDRLDGPDHTASSPFHDVHVRVDGPATEDLARMFDQRWRRARGTPPAFPVEPQAEVPGGEDVVQAARTCFHSVDPARALPWAPDGDFTLRDTVLRAIRSAREYIYVEDQYLTPPRAYREALLEAVESGRIRRLVIVAPTVGDQFLGDLERRQFAEELRAADPFRDDPDVTNRAVQLGFVLPRVRIPRFDRRSEGGKCSLWQSVEAGAGTEDILLTPDAALPQPPFWLAVEGELMLVTGSPPELTVTTSGARAVRVLRGAGLGLGIAPVGPPHPHRAPATVVSMSGIYVHSKMMIVDDLFVSVGSSNLNRRGFDFDGEINVFTVPASLRRNPDNLARRLRLALWAEHLGLPAAIAQSLLADPVDSAALFARPWLSGNRFVPMDTMPIAPVLQPPPPSGLVTLLQFAFGAVIAADVQGIWDTVIDPTTDEL